MSQEALLAALDAALGAGQVLRGEAIAERHRSDWSGVAPVLPLALVRPRDTREVSAVLRLCSEHRVPVVPQGGLTGLAGAAVPRADAIARALAARGHYFIYFHYNGKYVAAIAREGSAMRFATGSAYHNKFYARRARSGLLCRASIPPRELTTKLYNKWR